MTICDLERLERLLCSTWRLCSWKEEASRVGQSQSSGLPTPQPSSSTSVSPALAGCLALHRRSHDRPQHLPVVALEAGSAAWLLNCQQVTHIWLWRLGQERHPQGKGRNAGVGRQRIDMLSSFAEQ